MTRCRRRTGHGLVLRGVQAASRGDPAGDSWWKVMCLTGVDYFSTLGLPARDRRCWPPARSSPVATAGAGRADPASAPCRLPPGRRRRARTARARSRCSSGCCSFWQGKLFVLVLLGFAATDFIITMTLSRRRRHRAPGREPACARVLRRPRAGHHARCCCALLGGGLPARVHRGDRHRGRAGGDLPGAQRRRDRRRPLARIASDPGRRRPTGRRALTAEHGSPLAMVGVALLVFPKLALGMSGFETGVAVMPHVRGRRRRHRGAARPAGSAAPSGCSRRPRSS